MRFLARTGANLEYAKLYNLRLVLDTIRLHGPISRPEIAELTALTKQTIHNITLPLLKRGLVVDAGRKKGKRGAPRAELELNPQGAFAVGLDLDRVHLTGVLVDLGGNLYKRVSQPLDFPQPGKAISLMAQLTEDLLAGVDRDRVQGVGVGFPGPLRIAKGDRAAGVVNPYLFPGWQNVPVVDRLREALSLPVFLENNATAAAIGESFYGAGRNIGHFFYVFLGIGLGGGIILNGQPFDGFQGNAGEIGFLPARTQPDGQTIRLGSYFDLPTLYRQLALGGTVVTSPRELEGLLAQRHPVLLSWLEEAARHLAPALVGIEFSLDPEAIILGGSWPTVLVDHLICRLEGLLTPLRIAQKTYRPPLIRAQAGEYATAKGVATLPLYNTLAPRPTLLQKKPVQTSAETELLGFFGEE